ncbi:hypothetical protein L596_024207 [Steinernema carpocapsae]|uniref:Uncharacterized protein n=1 Tax=Steinernema carpocapsae TaxID=34508 RepID=A0A4U5MG26_STECR|nr:hypothetical protein L596_024207 [Steinernema carpocapsae]
MSYSMTFRPSTSLLHPKRPLRAQASLEDHNRVNIHVKFSSSRHNSLNEIVYRSPLVSSNNSSPRRSTSSTCKVTVEVSQRHVSRTSSTPNYLKSSSHKVVVVKNKQQSKKNFFIV